MSTNKFKVPQKMWLKFKANGQKVFNDVMEQSFKNQTVTTHPESEGIPKEQWKTICWNIACYAAWSVSGLKLEKGASVIDIDRRNKEVKKRKFN